VKSFNKEGEILGIQGDRAEMRLGAMKVAVKVIGTGTVASERANRRNGGDSKSQIVERRRRN
jgi:hypothetical protein